MNQHIVLANPAQACALGMVVGPTAAFLDVASGELTGTPTAAVAGPCGFEPAVRPVRPMPEDNTVLPAQRSGAAQGRNPGSGR